MNKKQRPECEIPDCSIKADDYKCFRGELTGFERFKQINLIIGKNNTGKSALIDLVEMICPATRPRVRNQSPDQHSPGPIPVKICHTHDLRENNINISEKSSEKSCQLSWGYTQNEAVILSPKLNANEIKKLNEKIHATKKPPNQSAIEDSLRFIHADPKFKLPLNGRALFRLEADRDLVPENVGHGGINVRPKGQDFTSLFHKYDRDGQLLALGLLDHIKSGLIEILGKDISLNKLQTAQPREQIWEVYLSEKNKKPVPISASGSGIKTILLALAYLYLLPQEASTDIGKCIFCFEELENNLHPSVQRRLFKYLLDFTRDNGCMLFLTTHSNVAIDIFSKCSDEEAQILHVTHNGTRASVDTIEPQRLGHVLDDLGYQASDILQSNYLVWVEGPSDRIHIRHALKKDHNLDEGIHYSIMFYGGRLLSHLDFDGTAQWDEEAVTELIDLAKINRNSAIVLDSDKSDASTPLNDSKNRIIEVFTDGNNDKCFAWVTAGREIENYVSPEVFKKAVDAVHTDTDWKAITLDQYAQRTVRKERKGKKSFIDKVKVARKLCENENLSFEFDWNEQIKKLADKIRAANGM